MKAYNPVQFKSMSFKDKLLQDIRSYAKEYRWEELAAEQAIEIVELRPSKVFSYLYEKRYSCIHSASFAISLTM
jgi:hypothetical protein